MMLNPEYEQEYNEALKAAAKATRELNAYLDSLEQDDDGRTHYPKQEEGHLLDQEREAIDRYHAASKNYFGQE
jgi:hypothetical protein